ncbi:LETM1-related biofilm-associated protein [Crocinitomicaceae bacterium]|nr:LETM1-related biofilm-associated protein [Crocinitomicaceae bacterium]
MLSPGAKGWIQKYFDLIERGEISLELDRPDETRKLQFMHLTLGHSGIMFGYPLQMIFAKNVNSSKWTVEEKLKLLLFESHLFVYRQIYIREEFDKDKFLLSLTNFYRHHNASAISRMFKVFRKESNEEMLESILAKRIDIKANILENKWWVNSLSNAFAYLDVILFDDFEHNREEEALKKYDNYAENALTAITLSVYSDGVIESKETDLFHFFLASANLDEDDRDLVRERFKKGATLQDFSSFVARHFLLKRFLFDVSVVTILATHEAQPEEVAFLSELGQHLEIDELEMEASMRMVENFVLKSKDQVAYLSDRSKYDKVYMSFTKRWTKVISRNSEKLKVELRESKELVVLIRKSGSQELTPEEKDAVKTQFKDLAKSIPALTVFMLPGGAVLMPLLLKLIPDLIPSAFKENTIDEEEAKDEDDETTEAPESNPK